MADNDLIIKELLLAIAAFEKGLALFEDGNYAVVPPRHAKEIDALCHECSQHMKAAQKLDAVYSQVYQQFSNGGNDTNCRLAKNRWCFAKIDFARARLRDLQP
jgi:hypothetical protein